MFLAVVVNSMCFVSGQLSVNINRENVCGTLIKEGNLVFSNLFSTIKNATFDKDDIFFDDLKGLPKINILYIKLFPEGKRSARIIYQAEALLFESKIKITATAVKEVG